MTSAFSKELATQTISKGPRCTVARILDVLDVESRRDLLAALADKDGAPSTSIARSLTAMDHPVKAFTVQNHRRRACACE